VAEALRQLAERIHLIHVTGDEGYGAALAARERLPEADQGRYRPEPFLRDEMLTALAAADLVVGRAGSSTLAEVTALGLPMVVVPYPHAGGHQRANALRLVEAGAARLIDDAALDGPASSRPPGSSTTRDPRRDVGGVSQARPAGGRRRRRGDPRRPGRERRCPMARPSSGSPGRQRMRRSRMTGQPLRD
jgi:hypothetical protein